MATILNLDKRLSTIIKFCPNTKTVADIGCDHGKIAAELILQSKAYNVIASDISPESLNKAVLLANKLNILGYISFRQGDGFSVISKHDKVDCAIIAGIGGEEIISIIKKSKVRVSDLVLQPMTDIIKVRAYLIQIGFKILEDVTIKEGSRFYHIIKLKDGKMRITDLQFYFGVTNMRELGEDFIEYIKKERDRILLIKSNVGELSQKNEKYLAKIEKVIQKYQVKKKNEIGDFNG